MSKKKPAKNAKPLSVKCRVSAPAPILVTCPTCGETYHGGAPHSAFCRGTKETKCSECGAEMSDDVSVAACRECGKVFCGDCGMVDERRCSDCEESGSEA